MKLNKTLRAAMAALLTLALYAQGLPSAYAANQGKPYDEAKGQDCALTVEFAPDEKPMTNNAFRIWKVGTLNEKGILPLGYIHDYHVLNGPGTWLDKAGTLLGYLQRDGVAPDASASTGSDGKVRFEIPAEDQGLYLVTGDSQYRDGTRYTPTPFLIMVPYTQDLITWETNVETHSKFTTYTPGGPDEPGDPDDPDDPDPDKPNPPDPGQPETIQRHVLKSWDDDGYEDQRPSEIVVDLLRDGQVYDTVTITAANNWRYDWSGLSAQYEWTVVERENDNYFVIVEREGITFHITNTWQEEIETEDPPLAEFPIDPTEPEEPGAPEEPDIDLDDPDVPLTDGPGLPKTGQLWWPVLPMAMGGLILIALGWKRRRDGSASDEA